MEHFHAAWLLNQSFENSWLHEMEENQKRVRRLLIIMLAALAWMTVQMHTVVIISRRSNGLLHKEVIVIRREMKPVKVGENIDIDWFAFENELIFNHKHQECGSHDHVRFGCTHWSIL